MTDEHDDIDEDEERSGIFGSVKSLLHRLVALLHRRAELFATELEEELTRLISVLVCSMVGIQCAIIGLTFIAVTVLLAVPASYRAWVAGGLAVLFLGLAAAGGLFIKKIVRSKTRPFDASLRELEKDREALRRKR
jgi:uncharacterized membrane protein YqjE